MKIYDKIIAGFAGFLLIAFIFYQQGIVVSKNDGTAILAFMGVVGMLTTFLVHRSGSKKDSMYEAEKYAKRIWKERTNEDLTYLDTVGVGKEFDMETFYAFTFQRLSGFRKGLPLLLLVKKISLGYELRAHYSNPTDNLLKDPFRDVRGFQLGSATKRPEPEAIPFSRYSHTPQSTTTVNVGKEKDKSDEELEELDKGGGN